MIAVLALALVPPQVAPPPRPVVVRAVALDGSIFHLPAAGGKVGCLLFVGADCPISNGYAPELARIAADYAQIGATVAVVYAAPDLTETAAAEHAREYLPGVPAVLDRERRLARRFGATIVPEAVVLSAAGGVLYRGRIDDRYPKPGGKRREQPTTRDLRDALDAALAGKPGRTPWPPAVGCDIPSDEAEK